MIKFIYIYSYFVHHMTCMIYIYITCIIRIWREISMIISLCIYMIHFTRMCMFIMCIYIQDTFLHTCIYIYIYICIFKFDISTYIDMTCIYIHIYIYMCSPISTSVVLQLQEVCLFAAFAYFH